MGIQSLKEMLFFTGAVLPLREGHPVQIQNRHPRLQAVAMQKETSAPIAAIKSLLIEEMRMVARELAARALHLLFNPMALLWAPDL